MENDRCMILLRDICVRIALLADMLRLREGVFGCRGETNLKVNPAVLSDEVCEVVRESLCQLQNEIVELLGDYAGDWFCDGGVDD